jgi:acetyl-CoA acetyltransferase
LYSAITNIAEAVAAACLISRDEQDEFALQSQLKCAHAMSLGHFDAEIEPIVISTSRSMLTIISIKKISFNIHYIAFFLVYFLGDVQIKTDEYPRQGVTMDALSKLKTVFKDGIYLISKVTKSLLYFSFFLAGTVTAGNSSGLLPRRFLLFNHFNYLLNIV